MPTAAPTGTPSAYPAEPDAAWSAATTPTVRSRAAGVDAFCLGPCTGGSTGSYQAGTRFDPGMARIVAAAVTTPGDLAPDAEWAARQAAIWFAGAGFVLDAGTEPAIRGRVGLLVAAAAAPDANGPQTVRVLQGGAGRPDLVTAGPARPDPAQASTTPPPTTPPSTARPSTAPPSTTQVADSTVAEISAAPTSAARPVDSSPLPTASAGRPTTTAASTATGESASTQDPATTSGPDSTPSRPTPSPTTSVAPAALAAAATEPTYQNCREVWDSIGGPLSAGDPGYADDLDADHDGIACEEEPDYTNSDTSGTGSADPLADASSNPPAAASPAEALAATGFPTIKAVAVGLALVTLGGSMVSAFNSPRLRRPPPMHRP